MIKLNKAAEPDVLVRNKAKWSEAYMKARQDGADTPSQYKHKDIKQQLFTETGDKCAYCESKLKHITFGDVEHILPRQFFPEKAFDWDNLTVACDKCNGNKTGYYNADALLLNPYTDNPDNHLYAFGTMIFHRPNDARGQVTIDQIQLNRGDLVESRKERIESLCTLVDRYVSTTGEVKRILEGQLRKELEKDKAYILVVREFLLKACGFQ